MRGFFWLGIVSSCPRYLTLSPLDECFLFHVITKRHYFLYKLIITLRIFSVAMPLRFLKQTFLKEICILFRHLHKNITMVIPKVNNKSVVYKQIMP